MIDIAVNDLHKYYGTNHILKGTTFEIYSGEKVGLLGQNGSGKTTLFKIIMGDEPYESGTLIKASGKRIEMLSQIPQYNQSDTALDVLCLAFREITGIRYEMERIESKGEAADLVRYSRLMELYEHLGGYDTDVRLDKVCAGMRLDDRIKQSPFKNLSGGEKTRVNLARVLLRGCDILLLDEPTNHLDIASLEWLERFLAAFPGTAVIISHDRVFLDRVITRIIEIEAGKANLYSGHYSWYAEEKKRRFISQSERYERQQKEIKRIEERAKWFVMQNPYTTKHHAILSRLDHMDKAEKPYTARKLTAGFEKSAYASKEIVSLDMISKRYGSKTLFHNVSLGIYKGDRIALIGPNGCGKTTLLKMIVGEEACTGGTVKVSVSVKAAYMPQLVTFPNENATVFETLTAAAGEPEAKTRSILAGFRFTSGDIVKKVSDLSGGERSRLKICLLMQNEVNFLLLDEPTNHLDIASREWIENALSDFEGTMLFVSHDRYFLNKFASKVWSMDNGIISAFDGGFDAYRNAPQPAPMKNDKRVPLKPSPKSKSAGVSVETLPPETRIRGVESALTKLEEDINEALRKQDYTNMSDFYRKKNRLETELDLLYREWYEND